LLEGYSEDLGEHFSFVGQSIPSLNVDFLTIFSAIRSQIPKKTSEETHNILKVIYSYFDTLNLDDDFKESVPNFLSAKAIILSYYTLNDLLLGKVVGDKENKKENYQLESVLQILANNTDFIVNIDSLKDSLYKVLPGSDLENMIDNSRGIFKEQLQHLSSLYSWSVRKKQL
jgi:hypothetical protein